MGTGTVVGAGAKLACGCVVFETRDESAELRRSATTALPYFAPHFIPMSSKGIVNFDLFQKELVPHLRIQSWIASIDSFFVYVLCTFDK